MLDNRRWENVFGGLKALRIELEVKMKDRRDLKSVIKRLVDFEIDVGNGKVLVREGDVRERYEDTDFRIATIVWR